MKSDPLHVALRLNDHTMQLLTFYGFPFCIQSKRRLPGLEFDIILTKENLSRKQMRVTPRM